MKRNTCEYLRKAMKAANKYLCKICAHTFIVENMASRSTQRRPQLFRYFSTHWVKFSKRTWFLRAMAITISVVVKDQPCLDKRSDKHTLSVGYLCQFNCFFEVEEMDEIPKLIIKLGISILQLCQSQVYSSVKKRWITSKDTFPLQLERRHLRP